MIRFSRLSFMVAVVVALVSMFAAVDGFAAEPSVVEMTQPADLPMIVTPAERYVTLPAVVVTSFVHEYHPGLPVDNVDVKVPLSEAMKCRKQLLKHIDPERSTRELVLYLLLSRTT